MQSYKCKLCKQNFPDWSNKSILGLSPQWNLCNLWNPISWCCLATPASRLESPWYRGIFIWLIEFYTVTWYDVRSKFINFLPNYAGPFTQKFGLVCGSYSVDGAQNLQQSVSFSKLVLKCVGMYHTTTSDVVNRKLSALLDDLTHFLHIFIGPTWRRVTWTL
jgi:hypothetical protein